MGTVRGQGARTSPTPRATGGGVRHLQHRQDEYQEQQKKYRLNAVAATSSRQFLGLVVVSLFGKS
eukprot:7719098-Pyramimonas_sp.AAC.1